MSFLNSEETYIPTHWYLVECGQGTYSARAYSADDAGYRVLQAIKAQNERREQANEFRGTSLCQEEVGLPLVTALGDEESTQRERIWRLTGGNPTNPDIISPLCISYVNPNPCNVELTETVRPTYDTTTPSLFAVSGEIGALTGVEVEAFMKGVTTVLFGYCRR